MSTIINASLYYQTYKDILKNKSYAQPLISWIEDQGGVVSYELVEKADSSKESYYRPNAFFKKESDAIMFVLKWSKK